MDFERNGIDPIPSHAFDWFGGDPVNSGSVRISHAHRYFNMPDSVNTSVRNGKEKSRTLGIASVCGDTGKIGMAPRCMVC
jgi:hypothetical protein